MRYFLLAFIVIMIIDLSVTAQSPGYHADFELVDYQIEASLLEDSLKFAFSSMRWKDDHHLLNGRVSELDSFIYTILSDVYRLPPDKNDLLIFIHGMWGSRSGALNKTLGQLNNGLVLQDSSSLARIISIKWPSNDWQYKDNKERAKIVGTGLAKRLIYFLRTIQTLNYLNNKSHIKIHLLSHSLGNFVLASLVEEIDSLQWQFPLFQEMILAAPDLDLDVMDVEKPFHYISRLADRIHLYFHRKDLTLKISKDLNDRQRLGLVGFQDLDDKPGNIYQVDVTNVQDETNLTARINKHHYYRTSPTVLNDFLAVLCGKPASQILYRARTPKTHEYILIENQK